MTHTQWLLLVLLAAIAAPAFGQTAPSGSHYAGRASDTGYTGSPVGYTGTYAASIPLNLPAARGGIQPPLQIVYRAQGVGAAGLGWDIPLSYVQSDRSFARRRPLSAPGALAVPRQRTYLSLLGQTAELDQQGSSDQWLAHSDTLALRVRKNGDSWQAEDGTGRLYTFVRPSAFGNTGIWLLESIRASGGGAVTLTYQTTSNAVAGGTGIEVSLTGLRYNPHPTIAKCWKNEVLLTYGFVSPQPLSLTIQGEKILTRSNLLTRIDVESRATCAQSTERLRSYEFEYPVDGVDPDTGLRRLRSVRMYGRRGTPEEFVALPVAAFDYGTATQDGALHYQRTQSIAQPADVVHDEISATVADESISTPDTGHAYAMWQAFIDVNGDGRPDLVFQKNNKLWVAYNQPAAAGTSTIGAGSTVQQLSDATFSDGPVSAHTSTQPRFNYLPAKSNIAYVWRVAVDVNGDGRIDIIDASEQSDHWVVYLNTPGPQGTVTWQRRSYSVAALRATLAAYGHIVPNGYVPLSKRVTGNNLKAWGCWRWSGTSWDWYSQGFGNRCDGVDGGVDGSAVERGPERTFVEWDLRDLNGDGYPDFVFNSTPVNFQFHAPCPTANPHPVVGAVCPRDFGIGGKVFAPFAPASGNAIRAMLNVLGVRFYTDDDPFARSFDLLAPQAEQGFEQWACSNSNPNDDTSCLDESLQSQYAAVVDVNGDGLADRVVGSQVFLGAYANTLATFSSVHLTLPGPLATQRSTHATACAAGSTVEATAEQVQGLRDVTGDGIPDYVDSDNHRVWIGTGTGFFHAVGVAVNGGPFRLSRETEWCDGKASKTDSGLFDLDGDGRPDIVELSGNTWNVYQLTAGGASGAPEAGRLIQIDNGYGAVTHIGYVSAKFFTDNPIPFPEIVVDSIAVSGTRNLGGTLDGTRYAYSNAVLVFDSVEDRFTFPGYGRSVELKVLPAPRDAAAGRLIGAATVTDTWPQPLFQPGISMDDRWLRIQLPGHVRDVTSVRGGGTLDPWSLLNIDINGMGVVGVVHTDWGAKRYSSPPNSAPGLANCIEIVDPYDFQKSLANAGNTAIDICSVHGFAFVTSTESWRGTSAPPSSSNVRARSRVLAIDDYGRVTSARIDNDLFRGDDDICIRNTFASPIATFARMLTAAARREWVDCERGNVLASEAFEYDNRPFGAVSAGRVTAHIADRRDSVSGGLIRSVRVLDASYDAAGNVDSVRTQRDSATRTTRFGYDAFGLVPTETTVEATNISPMVRTTTIDPVSLAPLASTGPHQVQRGNEFDGFGRWVRSTMSLPGSAGGVIAAAEYAGFDGADPLGRHVTVTRYVDPIPAPMLPGATGQSKATYVDELGRVRRTEVALGHDYGDESLVIGDTTYDHAGRVVFAARPYLKSQGGTSHYGASVYYKTTGDLDCIIRGTGPQPFTMVTDVSSERYTDCFDREYADHTMLIDHRNAASLQPNSPQEGVVQRTVSSAVGKTLEQSTLKAGWRIEHTSFGYDRLGQLVFTNRFLTPATPADPVQWSWQMDSFGHVLQLAEPESAARFFEYSDWGELTSTHWRDGAVDTRIVRRFDAMARLVGMEEQHGGVTDPASVRTYAYDTPTSVAHYGTTTFVQGRLSEAAAQGSRIALSYDPLGQINAQIFRDDDDVTYVQRFEHRTSGPLAELVFNLPDRNYDDERFKYSYDSAGRLRAVDASDSAGTQTLYRAEIVDPFGRVLKSEHGPATEMAREYAPQGRRLIRQVEIRSAQGSRRIEFANFDALGRESARREFVDNVTGPSPTYFAYDALGQLAAAQTQSPAGPSWQFQYDALGNLLKLRDLTGGKDASMTYRPTDWDRLCRIEYAASLTDFHCNVQYDAIGAVSSQPVRTGSRQLSYFASGAARTLTQGNSSARLTYDAFGNLAAVDVQSALNSEQRHDRHYGSLIERRDILGNNAPVSQILRRVPGPGGIIASRRGVSSDWIYGFAEPRGSRFFTDNAGTFVQSLIYQPFGEEQSTGAQAGTASYTAEHWNGGDALTAFGIVTLGARIYDPVIGRFLSRDPMLIAGGGPAGNPYSFAANDPINNSDPLGLCTNQICGIQAGSGDSGSSSGGLSLGPVLADVGSTLEHLSSLLIGIGKALVPSPSVAAGGSIPGAQTVEGRTLFWLAQMRFGAYSPAGFNFDAAARTGESAAATLDRIASMGSLALDAKIDAENAKIDRWKDTARIVGGGIAALALLPAAGLALAGGTAVAVTAAGVTTAATVAVPLAYTAEVYEPELENALSNLYLEEGIPATMETRFGDDLSVLVDRAFVEVPGREEEFSADIARIAQNPFSGWPSGISSAANPLWGDWFTYTHQRGAIYYDYVARWHHVIIRMLTYDPPQ